eukprot:GAHX01000020.1.p2 GENE.GAHX01000020.1~~GAHX01000020.1.p2  ORF type:complete len:621 (-),score=92.06 GAHX01000020.1:2547-4409(-)
MLSIYDLTMRGSTATAHTSRTYDNLNSKSSFSTPYATIFDVVEKSVPTDMTAAKNHPHSLLEKIETLKTISVTFSTSEKELLFRDQLKTHVAYLDFDPNFSPKTATFSLQPTNTTLHISCSIPILESIERQDVYSWADTFRSTIIQCNWDEGTSINTLKALTTSSLLCIYQGANTLEEMMIRLLAVKYPKSSASHYLNELAIVRQSHYPTVSTYVLAINCLVTRLYLCRGEDPSKSFDKRTEVFYNGLTRTTKKEMVKLGLHDANSIYNNIKNVENFVLEECVYQLRAAQTQPSRAKTHKYKNFNQNTDYQQGNYSSRNANQRTQRAYCRIHGECGHTNSQCRRQQQNGSREYNNPRNSTSYTQNQRTPYNNSSRSSTPPNNSKNYTTRTQENKGNNEQRRLNYINLAAEPQLQEEPRRQIVHLPTNLKEEDKETTTDDEVILAIQEPSTGNSLPTIQIPTGEGIPSTAIIDSGAQLNFISNDAFKKLKLEPKNIPQKTIVLANGGKEVINSIVSLSFQIEGNPNVHFKEDLVVLSMIEMDIILGLTFLRRQEAVLNFKDGTIAVAGFHFELGGTRNKWSTFDKTIVEKTKVLSFREQTPTIDEEVRKYKLTNPITGIIT